METSWFQQLGRKVSLAPRTAAGTARRFVERWSICDDSSDHRSESHEETQLSRTAARSSMSVDLSSSALLLSLSCLLLAFLYLSHTYPSFVQSCVVRPNSAAPRVGGLYVYPLKSCMGIPLEAADFIETGIRYDRHWMIVEADTHTMVTARTFGCLLLVKVELDVAASVLRITIPGVADTPASSHTLPFAPPDKAEVIEVRVHGSSTDAIIVADDSHSISKALSGYLDRPVIVVQKGETLRESGSDDYVSRLDLAVDYANASNVDFADGFPFLIATTSSMLDLRAHVSKTTDAKVVRELSGLSPGPLAIRRFRPNIVVDGNLKPFEEDGWRQIRLGDFRFHVASRCTRCPMPNVDPVTGVRGTAVPAITLSAYRKVDPFNKGLTCFGVNCLPVEGKGTIRVGDKVEILSRFPADGKGAYSRPEDTFNS